MERTILNTLRAMDTSDGAGVRLKRALGSTPAVRLDPFLMLDAFSTTSPVFRRIHIAVLKPSPIWWKATCVTGITWVMKAILNRVACNG